jgi:hypothetical protein
VLTHAGDRAALSEALVAASHTPATTTPTGGPAAAVEHDDAAASIATGTSNLLSNVVRLRASSKLKAALLKTHKSCSETVCSLGPEPNYQSIFTCVQIALPKPKARGPDDLKWLLTLAGGDAAVGGTPGGAVGGGIGGGDTVMLWGASPRELDWTAPDSDDDVICRAQHKLEEAFVASPILTAMEPSALKAMCAIDIGASPGGWTACLAKLCKRVCAVDAGKLHPDVTAMANVDYVPHLLPPIHDADAEGGAEAAPPPAQSEAQRKIEALAPVGGFGIACCDINMGPQETCDIVSRAKRYLAPGAILVITLKLAWRSRKSAGKAEKAERAVREVLAAQIAPHMEIVWLFSNTVHERTLIARLLP